MSLIDASVTTSNGRVHKCVRNCASVVDDRLIACLSTTNRLFRIMEGNSTSPTADQQPPGKASPPQQQHIVEANNRIVKKIVDAEYIDSERLLQELQEAIKVEAKGNSAHKLSLRTHGVSSPSHLPLQPRMHIPEDLEEPGMLYPA